MKQAAKRLNGWLGRYAVAIGSLALPFGALLPLDWLTDPAHDTGLELMPPAPGHPEILDSNVPMTDTERLLWADLNSF